MFTHPLLDVVVVVDTSVVSHDGGVGDRNDRETHYLSL